MENGRAASLVTALVAVFAAVGCGGGDGAGDESVQRAESVSADSFLDKTTAGYQGWFVAGGDGSPVGGWAHWALGGPAPAPGKVTFELYPDTREYAPADLHESALGALGDGRPAALFSSFHEGVVDTHFRWMAEAGIDGVGLQRFVGELSNAAFFEVRNTVTKHVRAAAERHGRIFYITYDISGAPEATLVEDIARDWDETIVGALGATQSPQYVHQDGRPVVMLWGFGFGDRPGTVQQARDAIAFFHERGCYVGLGVPYEWRTGTHGAKPGYLDAYADAELIQPWSVGWISSEADVDTHFSGIVEKDKAWASERGIAYQRVIYPGFAWSNWNGGTRNQIPRNGGRLFWKQATAVRSAGISAFIAMFDEYDEGTAIAKAAENASQTPSSQYFLTLDADGTAMSSDFYLRLSGAATRMIRGEQPVTESIPIPYLVEGGGGGCSNVCTSGAKQCADGDGFVECKDWDNDGCTEWSEAFSCGASWPGTVCSAGYCVGSSGSGSGSSGSGGGDCNACSAGGKQCVDNDLYQDCGDFDQNGCTEWSPVYSCNTSWPGTHCSNGWCVY